VARFFGIPVEAIAGAVEGGGSLTYQNVSAAQQQMSDALVPWATLWEEELDRKLIAPLERTLQFTAITLEALVRADLPTRYAAYETGIRAGILTVNEARQRENLPERPAGDTA